MWKRTCRRVLSELVVLSLLLFPLAGAASYESGIEWLKQQQMADGSFYSPGTISTRYQASAEALTTLSFAGALTPDQIAAARAYFQLTAADNNEWLARRIFVGIAITGEDTSILAQELLSTANTDGGIGDGPGYDSAVLNTSLSLIAFSHAGLLSSPKIGYAVQYMLAEQQVSGGWADGPNHSSPYVSALASLALQRYRFHFNVGAAIASASDFLLQTQAPTGGWGTTAETALALLAVIPVTTDATRYATAMEALRAAQSPDGSWDDDVFTTALALRVLHLVQTAPVPSDPTRGTVSGQVVADQTGLSLEGVNIALTGVAPVSVLTKADGRFAIENLAPGGYTVTYSAPGFASAQQTVTVSAGQHISLGMIRLRTVSTDAVLFGLIKRADTGAAIEGAVVSVTGAATGTAYTDAEGQYLLTFQPGDVTISVTADGFLPIGATASVGAGSRVSFSPSLYLEGSSPPAASVEVFGAVVDADTKAPLSSAEVRVVGTAYVVTSDALGAFSLSELAAGEISLEVTANGYQPVIVRFVATAGSNVDVGTLHLLPAAKASTSLYGMVSDRDSGAPIGNATVHVGDLTAQTDAAGQYRVDGIGALAFDVSVAATGYLSQSNSFVLQQHGLAHLDITLQKVAVDGIKLTEVLTDKPIYEAYEDVTVTAQVENKANESRRVVLAVTVLGTANGYREDFIAPASDASRDPAFTLAAGQAISHDISWATRHLAPGEYRIIVLVLKDDLGTVLSEGAAVIEIAETRALDSLAVFPDTMYFVRGTSGDIGLSARVRNASNVDLQLSFDLSVTAPSGVLAYQGTHLVEVTSTPAIATIPFGSFSHTFVEPGTYQLTVSNANGATFGSVQTGAIDVAPDIRIEGQLSADPPKIVPGTNKKVIIKLNIKGVEDQP